VFVIVLHLAYAIDMFWNELTQKRINILFKLSAEINVRFPVFKNQEVLIDFFKDHYVC